VFSVKFAAVTVLFCLILDRGFLGSYVKCMACVEVPFTLPCLEAECKAAAAAFEHSDHWYAAIDWCFCLKCFSRFFCYRMIRYACFQQAVESRQVTC